MRYNAVQLAKDMARRFLAICVSARPSSKARSGARLWLETLEDRCCPSGLHLTAQTLNLVEGQSSMMGPMVLATVSDADGNASPTSFTASVDYGDGSGPSTAFVTNWYGPLQVVGSHAYPEEGSYNLTLTVTDTDGDQAVLQEPAVVADAPLSTGMNMPISTTAGQPISPVVASFTDANYSGTAGDFTASISWGDGTTNSAGTVSGGGGWGGASFLVNGSHAYAAVGTYAISVAIQDVGGSAVVAANMAQVAPHIVVTHTWTNTTGDGKASTAANWTNGQGNRITQPRNSSQAPCRRQVNRRKIPSEVAPFRRKIHGPRLEDLGVLL